MCLCEEKNSEKLQFSLITKYLHCVSSAQPSFKIDLNNEKKRRFDAKMSEICDGSTFDERRS